ncbi:ribonuclease R [Deinococcus sp. SL84]|uniref:ribonuclease R n=1 Tax=Deinococcus sp. SL84 TaxID=2994663 RepID=UPI0022755496|nr:ribonuclease R [Deinococcus sp. SL84]MCY1702059.1 ribonuclease R [Deinococcus sp. SL84]
MPKTKPKAATSEQLEVAGTEQNAKPARTPRKKATDADTAGKSKTAKGPARSKKAASKDAVAKEAAAKGAAKRSKKAAEASALEAAPARRTRKAAAKSQALELNTPPVPELVVDTAPAPEPSAAVPGPIQEAPAQEPPVQPSLAEAMEEPAADQNESQEQAEPQAQAEAEAQLKPRRTGRRNAATAEEPAAAKKPKSTRRRAAAGKSDTAAQTPESAAESPGAAVATAESSEEAATSTPPKKARPRRSKAALAGAAASTDTGSTGSEPATAEAAGTESVAPEAAAPEQPVKPRRSPRSTSRSKNKAAAESTPAAPEVAVPMTAEAQEPLTDLPVAEGEAPQSGAAEAEPVRRSRRSGRRQVAAAGPAEAPAEADTETAPAAPADAADEPLVLHRPKRGKRKAQPREDVLDTDLEKLSGVEPVEPQGEGEPAEETASEPAGELTDDMDESAGSDVLAALLPDLPPAPPAPTPAAEPGRLSDPVQELLVSQLRSIGRPIHVRDLEKSFTRQKARLVGSWRDIEGVLEDLTRSGLVVRTRKKTYGLPGAMNLVRGRFQAAAAGFGFVVPDSGREDYYVPAESTLEAWNGDTVLVRPEGHGPRGGNSGRRGSRFDGNPQATVVRIVQRHYSQLVGTLEYSHGYPILKADDFRARHRILLLSEGLEELEAGARVVVDLYWPEDTGEDEVFGQISRVLGEEDDPETETEAVMVKYGLRGEFPPEVLSEAGRIPAEIPESALRGRLDLRELNTFTVDGRDAKDFDDAIHIQPTEAGTFLVGVHIADVSHYVRAGSELDGEAYARATSVYLPGRVLPMLPEHLSNGVCSLVPNEDRLTMSALVELSADAEILNVEIGPSVIHSKARLTYDEVQAYSEGTSPMPEHARHLEGDLHLLLKVTTKLRQKRLREGSLDFKMREVKVDVDEDGRMELIPLREETARGMIEDLMLLANKAVAHFLLERNVPTLFRIHEEPTLQRFQDVSQAIGRLGLAFPGGEPTPQAYQEVLKQVRGTPRESVVNTLLLRSMQQAKYAGENLGHFGLAFDEYLHFTSPIRRYPDLMVHRVLRGVLSGELRPASREVDQLRSALPSMGEHTSDRERNAAEAERDLTKYYQAKWAQEHQGLSFMGSVSGVVASGLFVALDNGVEGKLHISNLDDDYYIYLEDAQMLKGRSTGRTFRLGDALAVTISEVKPLARQIDFTVPEEGTELEEIVMSENQPSGNKTQGSGQKVGGQRVRARRREDREQERQQKLSNVRPSQPRFTLDEDAAGRSQGRGRGPRSGNGEGRSGEGQGRAQGGRPGRDGGQGGRSRGGQAQGGTQGGSGRRRVITLERPRNEHLRPVNITVQRMYFGDWSVENMPEDDGQPGSRPGRSSGPRGGTGRVGGREGRPPQGGRGRSEEGNGSGHGGAQPQGQGEGDRRRRRRRSRRPGSETPQG